MSSFLSEAFSSSRVSCPDCLRTRFLGGCLPSISSKSKAFTASFNSSYGWRRLLKSTLFCRRSLTAVASLIVAWFIS